MKMNLQGLNNMRRFKFRMLVMVLLFSQITLIAQPPAAYVRKGNEAIASENWGEAFGYFQQAYELDTTDFEIRQQYALSAFRVKRYDLAYGLFASNYAKDNGEIHPESLYWMAVIEKLNGKYEDAQRNFKKFIKKHKSSAEKVLVEQAEFEQKSALWALEHHSESIAISAIQLLLPDIEMNHKVSPIQLSGSFESTASPFSMGDQLLFSAYQDGHWQTQILNMLDIEDVSQNVLSERYPINGNLESPANPMVFEDQLFFSAQKDGRVVICTAEKNENAWTNVRVLEKVNDKGEVNTMPYMVILNGRKTILFSSDREGGEGGMDIWLSEYDGQWSEPRSAGKQVNTSGDELTPSVFGDYLVFCSDGHYGFGGYDLFLATYVGKSFERPQNLGTSVNSSFHDVGFALYKKEELVRMVIASNRRSNDSASEETCCNKLFAIDWSIPEDSILKKQSASVPDDLVRTLPVVLYFHNDEPDPRSRDTTTKSTYGDAYRSYLNLIPKYIAENTKGLSDESAEDAESITRDFFDLQVKEGKRDLESFFRYALKELQAGKSLRIYVRGFASPRAESDYNLNLTKRRTASLVNEMRADSSGIFLPYIEGTSANGAKIEFTLLPFGEFKSDASVSDDLRDERNSIYNRSACLERKIEIEKIEYFTPVKPRAELQIDQLNYDFGLIPWFGEVNHDFVISNTGNLEMVIDSVIAECGCTTPVLDNSILKPGESTRLHVGFNPISTEGTQIKQIFVYVRGEEPKVITISATRRK